VGCKDICSLLCIPTISPFYLNYVGCKVINLVNNFDELNGFTLTMWDVKKKNILAIEGNGRVLP